MRRPCASAGSRTRIISTSAARSSFSISSRYALTDALAPAHGRGRLKALLQESLATQHAGDEAEGPRPGRHRHNGAAQGGDVPHRRQAPEPSARSVGRRRGRPGSSFVSPMPALASWRSSSTSASPCAQFKRANKALRKLKTYLGRVIHDLARRTVGRSRAAASLRSHSASPGGCSSKTTRQRGRKIYSLHAPEVECIGKGKAHRPYEFGVKVSVATTLQRSRGGQFVAHIATLPGNP